MKNTTKLNKQYVKNLRIRLYLGTFEPNYIPIYSTSTYISPRPSYQPITPNIRRVNILICGTPARKKLKPYPWKLFQAVWTH